MNRTVVNSVYFAFLRYCLDDDKVDIPVDAIRIDWRDMLSWAERQAIIGIVFGGIQKADKALNISTAILYEWIGYANQIESQNRLLNNRCVELTECLRQNRFVSCILKGQGNALMYPNPLWRTSGDIDVWVMPSERLRVNGSGFNVKEVIRLARKKNPGAKACYHHVDYGEFNGVEVELHYRPSFMFNPLHNRRLQRWFIVHGEGFMVDLSEGIGSISVPNWEFNVVFQLSHVYNHLLHEGIGLRQILDYYYLLKSGNSNQVHDSRISRLAGSNERQGRGKVNGSSENWEQMLKYLGLKKIAGAMMWVLGYLVHGEGFMVYGFKRDEWMICEPDERRGKVLLAEIMKGGNFGHYDAENQKANNAIKRNLQRVKRDMRMMRYFPSECLWEPVFRVYHYFWRMAH